MMKKLLVLLLFLFMGANGAIPNMNLLGNITWNFDVHTNPFEECPWHFTGAHEMGPPFDFIVVGSGAAGAVIANRLSENPNWNVLLLEVGETPTQIADIPLLLNYFQFTDYNWGYLMEDQPNMCLGLTDRRMSWPRGKVLGGTSVINFMIHIRGNRLDYDRWAQNGNPGWSYDEVLPYFKKSEDFLVRIQDPDYHSKGGYLGAQDVSLRLESSNAFIKAMQEFGYKYVDYNGKEQMGVSYVQATNRNSKRASAYNAFLVPILRRPNLKIYTKARVTKILIDEATKSAYGVSFIKNQKNFIARASKEVIISAGALNSPQLLMLSGIGPRTHLEELGVAVLQDLPVGQKLYDHLAFLGLVFTANSTITFQYENVNQLSTMLEYILFGRGYLTSLSTIEALGIVKTNVSDDPDPTYPDIELIFTTGSFHTDKGEIYRKTFRISDETYNKVWKPLEGREAFGIFPMLYHPRSYGHIKLKSKNPYHWPRFYGNYFTDPDNFDVKTFTAGIRLAQEIIKMPAFQKYDAKIWDVKLPGCEEFVFNTDEYWECALRHLAATVHHQVSTCKMGPPTDPEAVVNHELKVYNINNLRVADTSIIPFPISAHTNVPAFMIGEKAADIIKQAWGMT
ncbi:hypothetical protein Trydic_g2513 [Trypoxylus dichotomus]